MAVAPHLHAEYVEGCFRCKLEGIQVSPSATPNRRNQIPPRTPNNSWERGIAKDSRGMPYLEGGGLEPYPIKAWGEKGRHEHREARERAQSPPE